MGKKEASKGRVWEKKRRDILNENFQKLREALPNQTGTSLSQKTILTEAISYIHKLEQDKRNLLELHKNQHGPSSVYQEGDEPITEVIEWIRKILQRQNQLTGLLKSAGIPIPDESNPISLPPGWSEKINPVPRSEIESQIIGGCTSKKEKKISKKKRKDVEKAKENNTDSSKVISGILNGTGEKTPQQSCRTDKGNAVSTTCLVQTTPMVMPSQLHLSPQFIFTSSSTNSTLPTSLPLFVSVPGVKTANPVILVQSNAVPPTPLGLQNTQNTLAPRPIVSGPPDKSVNKVKKVAIPSLKPKFKLGLTGNKKSKMKKGSKLVVRDAKKNAKVDDIKENSVKGNKSIEVKKNKLTENVIKPTEIEKNNKSMNNIGPSVSKENSNIASSDQSSSKKEINAELKTTNDTLQNVENNTEEVNIPLSGNEKLQDTLENQESNDVSKNKRQSESEITSKEKRVKLIPCGDGSKEIAEICEDTTCVPSPSKSSKSNYSISALCSQQQEQVMQAPSDMQVDQNKPDAQDNPTNAQAVRGDMENGGTKDIIQCFSNEKMKEASLPTTEQFLEWSDKSHLRSKSDKICPNYNPFSGMNVHNSKNTFIPISDVDSYKSIPEVFDTGDNSFGLPLHSGDISSDIFASLQVSGSGHHSESISPTAAFLLAFPLVSTSKASELLGDESVCENTDSQQGMKTILQIGNLDNDTPVTKCVSIYSTPNVESVVFSTSNTYLQDNSTILAKSKTIVEGCSVGNELANKTNVKDSSGCRVNDKISSTLAEKSANEGMAPSYLPRSNDVSNSKADQNIPQSSAPTVQSFQDMLQIQPEVQNKNNPAAANKNQEKTSNLCIPMSTENHQQKNNLKPTTVSGYQKKQDWAPVDGIIHTQNAYSDISPMNSQSQCSHYSSLPIGTNTTAPNLRTDNQMISNASFSIAQNSTNFGILSWSTIPPLDSSQATKPPPPSKSGNISDIFSIKPSEKISGSGMDVMLCNNNAEVPHFQQSVQSELKRVSTSTSYVSSRIHDSKINASVSSFNVSKPPSSVNHFSQATLSEQKQNAPNYVNSNPQKQAAIANHYNLQAKADKKHCYSSSGKKQNEEFSPNVCTPPEPVKDFGQRPEGKYSSHVYNLRPPAELNKQIVPQYNQNISVNPKTSSSSQYKQSEQNFSMPYVQAETKQLNSSYIHGSSNPAEAKKSSQFNQQKQNLAPQYNQSENGPIIYNSNVSQEHHQKHPGYKMPGQEEQQIHHNKQHQKQYHVNQHVTHQQQDQQQQQHNLQQQQEQIQFQQQLQFTRSSKESTTNLHRPPVNWMTGPDIRSHQHHNGPSFGNSSNSANGMLFLSEHMKESDPCMSAALFDPSNNFHCLDISHSGQPVYKGNELQLFSNEALDNIHENNSWSPNKTGNSALLGNMLIPSTLPTLVGDLALGDNNISRPFLPPFSNNNNDGTSYSKKPTKRTSHNSKRLEKHSEEATTGQGLECSGSFLSVSQLVESGNSSKVRSTSLAKECFSTFPDDPSKQSSAAKSMSSSYSAEALLSNSQQSNQHFYRKRRGTSSHYSNAYSTTDVSTFSTNGSQPVHQTQMHQGQCSYLPDLSTAQFLHSEIVPPFVATTRNAPRNSFGTERNNNLEENSEARRSHHSSSTQNTITTTSTSSNIMDFGYMNVTSTMLPEEVSFANHSHTHPPPPTFLPHPTYAQDTLYVAPRLSMHHQNNNIQSPSATTLTNFHLSTIFPEINEKVIC